MATQDYGHHAHRPILSLIAALCATAGLAALLLFALRQPGVISFGLVMLALSVMCLVSISRVYTVKLQDRIIRLEMQIRLERLGRGQAFGRLATRQLVALRFASDAELPALVDRTLADQLDADAIKRAVSDWQPDLHRT
ncbi:MAG: DUF6526 family protein [Vicinamibacterales bacterium]